MRDRIEEEEKKILSGISLHFFMWRYRKNSVFYCIEMSLSHFFQLYSHENMDLSVNPGDSQTEKMEKLCAKI